MPKAIIKALIQAKSCVDTSESGVKYWYSAIGGSVTDATTPKDGILLFVTSHVMGISNNVTITTMPIEFLPQIAHVM
jgi:hypothetical protein